MTSGDNKSITEPESAKFLIENAFLFVNTDIVIIECIMIARVAGIPPFAMQK